jgi:eukaryotic-like serine/threonine-protein kinase
MTPERWEQVNELFHSALEREPAQRPAFLDQVCADDQELRKEVESLICSNENPDSFIDGPGFGGAAQLLAEESPDLSPGQRIGHYQIISLLGSGGMGEVYLAQDSKLGRKVALKLLAASFTKDEARVRRFALEARAVSALNHPNILTIYDVDEVDGIHFIATEHIEGQTLRQRIADSRLQVSEALSLATQVASALSAAHQAGIVHRDIKPENIMLRPDGYVKVLDFGLAKLTEPPAVSSDGGSPAYAGLKTDTGAVIGTVSYMSPEQAKGQHIDERSDVFSFGVMLYEMLTGEVAFRRDSDVETLHAIIYEEPPRLSGLRARVPAGLESVLRRCLEKQRETRYGSGCELAAALEKAVAALPLSAGVPWARGAWPRPWRRAGSTIAAAAFALTLVIVGLLWFYIPASSPKSSLTPMKVVPFTSFPGVENLGSFSPDGNQIAFGWNGENGDKDQHSSIYVKQIGSERPLRLTFDTAHNDWGPVWSPDGQRIAFNRQSDTDCAIYIVPALGGAERKVLTCPNTSLGGLTTLAWSPDGKYIAFTSKDPKEEPAKIHLVSPDTFARRTLTSPSAENAGDLTPAFSPDSQRVAFARQSSAGTADIYIVPITGGEPTRLTFDNAVLRGLAWTADGREIIFSSSRADGGAGQHYDFGLAFISGLWRISASGGAAERVTIGGLNFFFPNISRQGNRLTYVQRSPEDANIYRIEISDTTVSKNPPTKLIASTRHDGGPQFSPDGKKIVFHSARSGPLEIWMCDSDGRNFVQLTFLNRRAGSPRWSPDGQQIVFDFYEEGKGDIYVISAEGGVPRPIVTGDADDHLPNWSRDGKWIYFASDRSGKHQVWKVSAGGGEALQVTMQGGVLPCESPDGKYVYYSKGLGTRGLWRVPVDSGEEVRVLDFFKSELGVVVNEGIYFINPDAKGGAALGFFDFATRKERHVAGLGKITIISPCVAVSPDRRCILYAQNDQIGADIMLVENFR